MIKIVIVIWGLTWEQDFCFIQQGIPITLYDHITPFHRSIIPNMVLLLNLMYP